MSYSSVARFASTLSLTIATLLAPPLATAAAPDPIILMIGASYGNGATPFNDDLVAPLGGVAVNLGDYLSLGQAMTASPLLGGKLINEAEAGATTFDRPTCGPTSCGPGTFQGYEKQLQKALARVAIPDLNYPGAVLGYTAQYLVITTPNDCLHADSEGVPQNDAVPCSPAQLDAVVSRLIAIGQEALDKGITPIYNIMPAYQRLDLPHTEQAFGLQWVIDEASYNYLRHQQANRIRNELPGALLVNAWRGFEHLADGLHPNEATARRAARRIALVIKADQARRQQ